jgi:nucleotide-binding universal stress UspA family protein
MYNTVLVPLDGSERAENILPHVKDIAQHHQAKIIFVTVLEMPHTIVAPDGIYVPSEDVIEAHHQEAEAYLQKQVSAFNELGLKAESCIAHGRVVDAICKVAQKENVDLVALASHGRSGLAQAFYGSVAIGLLHRITRPLLMVRAE